MVSVGQATEIIQAHCYRPGKCRVPISDAVGRILAEEILCDRDFPPFDRAAMDGIAIAYAAWVKGVRVFPIESVQPAGARQQSLINEMHCIEIMTGAILPEGTDAVIRYEDVTMSNASAAVNIPAISQHQHIHRRAQDATRGDVLLKPGMLISPAEVALLASVGSAEVPVFSFPSAAIVSTGNELVDVPSVPEMHQIRRSNTYALEAAMKQSCWKAFHYHVPDEKETLVSSLRKIMHDHDVIILSGGVSKGKFDYIPEVLEEIGVQKLFYQVQQRPGKPFWFGVGENKFVFALPGNPVSIYMCYYRYIRPWLLKSLQVTPEPMFAVLANDVTFKPELTYFLQARIKNEHGRLMAYPAAGGGSGDLGNLKDVDGFLELPFERSVFSAGEVFPFVPFR